MKKLFYRFHRLILLATKLTFKPKHLGSAILALTFALQILLPLPAQAQDDLCSIAQGTIDSDNVFTQSSTGSDFKITCEGQLTADVNANTFKALLMNEEPDYTASQSKVIIDISGVSTNTHGITINSDAEKTILTGEITNDDTVTNGSVVSVNEGDPGSDGVSDDVIFESQATIISEGNGRFGLRARFDSENANASSELTLENSGTITTSGDDASGLGAYFELEAATIADSADALGLVSVTNSGTITVKGNGTGSGFITGLEAAYRTKAGNLGAIFNSGDVKIENSGEITASGDRAKGIYALTEGRGKVDISVSGTVSAGHQGDSGTMTDDPKTFGIGIHAHADTDHPVGTADDITSDPDTDIDVMIVVTGSGASIMAYGASSDDDTTADFDESKGITILAETGASTGHSYVEINSGAKVSAASATAENGGYAVMFKGGKGTLDIDGANLVGNIMFTDNDDELKIAKTGSIEGDIDFGEGDDTMDVDIGKDQRFQITGNITDLTTLTKEGAGYVRFGGDVSFQGDSVLNLEDGALVIAGKLDLGSGEVTVHEAGKIVFEIGSGGSIGSITADSIHFEEIEAADVSVYAQLNDDLEDDEDVSAARTGLTADTHELLNVNSITSGESESPTDVDSLSIKTVKANDATVSVGSIAYADNVGTATFDPDEVDQIAKLNPGPPVSSGGDDNNNAILVSSQLTNVG